MTTSPQKNADKTCGFASIYDLKLLREPKTHVFHEDMITMFSCVKHTLWIMMEDDNLLLQ